MTISHSRLAEMDEQQFEDAVRGWPTPKRAAAEEAIRAIHIRQMAKNFSATDAQVREALERGHDSQQFLETLRAARAQQGQPLNPPPTSLDNERSLASRDPVFGLDTRDVEQWSMSRALTALASGRLDEAPYEVRLSDHCRQADPRREYRGRGLTVPLAVFQRAIGKGTPNSSGAGLVGVEHLGGAFIDTLRPFLATSRLGITMIPASGADISIPRQISSAATTWVDEAGGTGESSLATDNVTMTPHTVRTRSDITRRMLKQGDPAVDMLVQRDLLAAIGTAVDAAALAGSGTGPEPEGILGASGVGSVTYDATSGLTERASLVQLTDDVASANVRMTAPGFVFRSSVRARYMTLPIDPGSGRFLFDEGQEQDEGRVIGMRAVVSNNLPGNLGAGTNETPILFGNWSDLLMATWGTIDLLVDDVTLGDSGGLVMRAFYDVDVALRHPESFSVAQLVP